MPHVFIVTCILIASFLSTALATEPTRKDQLDQLFVDLKQAPDENRAIEIEQEIWKLWMTTNNPKANFLMQKAMKALRGFNYDKALTLLDQIITIDPTYAEAWNQRVIIYFQRNNYEQALEQVTRTLELEPRHFGALAGRGIIRLRQGKSALAIQSIKAAMVYHPFLRERNLIPTQYLDKQ